MILVDRIVGIIALVGGAILALSAWQIGLGNFRMPGPGAWPFLMAIALTLNGALLFSWPDATAQPAKILVPRWARLILTLGTLFAYALLFEWLGYIIDTVILLFIQFKWVENCRLKASLLLAVLASIISYLLFALWLKVALPTGFIRLGL